MHQPPQIQTLNSSVNYTEGAAPVTLSPSAFAISPDGHPILTKAVIRIDPSTYQPGDELLVFDTTLGTASTDGFYTGINVDYHFDPATGVLTLSGRDTNVDYSHVLDNIQFHSTSDNPDNAGLAPSRTITWQLTDAAVPFGPDFAAPVSYSAGTSPQAVLISTTSADFNGDLIPDLAVGNAGSATVSILLGNGDGTFQPAVDFAAGASQSSIARGDFDGDFLDDLLVTNKTTNTVSLLLGDGAGHFASPTTTATGVAPTSLTVGDFNEDGKLDIAVANAGIDPTTVPGTVWVMLGDGNGNFGVPLVLATGLNPTFVATAALHLTGSTHQDLVVANTGSNSISIFMGDGAGHFTPAAVPTVAVGTAPVAAVDARFNIADPGNDLAVVNSGSNNVTVLFGNNDGTFSGSVNVAVGTHPNSIAVGDFDGDQKIDFVTANGDGTVSLVYGNGDGTFQSALTYSAGTNAVSVAVADLSNDGNEDLAVADAGANAVSILLHNPTTQSQLYTTNINVTAVNDPPVNTVPGAQSTNEDTNLVFTGTTAIQVSDVDGGAGNETVTLSVTHGTLAFGGSSAGLSSFTNNAASIQLTGPTAAIDTALSSLSYAPAADYNGSDTLTVATNDNGHTGVDPSTLSLPNTGSTTDERATSTVAITINAVADTVTDNLTTPEDTPVTQNVLTGNDGVGADNFENPDRSVSAVTQGAHGSVTFLANGSVTYTPNADYNGSDSFTYTVTSGGVTETGTVNVTVSAVADTVADSLATNEDTAITANVLTGTNGASADNFEDAGRFVSAVTQGAHGSVTFAANGSVTYSPDPNYNGGDTFTYTITAGGVTETGNVNVTVNAINDAPVAAITPTSYSATKQTALNLKNNGLAVSDVDGGPLGTETVHLTVTEGVINVTAGGSGATVNNSGTADVTITGTVAQINALLNTDGTSTVSYIDNTDTPGAGITLTLLIHDNGNTGTGGDLSSSDSAAINVLNLSPVSNVLWGHVPTGLVAEWLMTAGQIADNKGVGSLDADFLHSSRRGDDGRPQWHFQDTGDFNADGSTDILWRHDNGQVVLWTLNGPTIAANQSVATIGNDWQNEGVGDFNGDGRADVLWHNDNGQVALWTMDGAQITNNQLVATLGGGWHFQGLLDANGDGKSDVLLRNDTGQVVLWTMNGAQISNNQSVANLGLDWNIQGTGDFNGDGRGDVLLRNDSGQVVIWQMNGAQITSNLSVATPGNDWHVQDVGDYSGDGKSDVLWRNDSGQVVLWEMNGAQIVSNHTVTYQGGSPAPIGLDWIILTHHYDLL